MGNSSTKEHSSEATLTKEEKKVLKGVHIQKENIPSFKILFVGDCGVGKSSLLLRYTMNRFYEKYSPTRKVQIENILKTVNVPNKSVSAVTVWDIPGSEDIDLRSTYYRNVDAVAVVVDLSDVNSIELAGAWKQEFYAKATRSKPTVQTLDDGREVTKLEETRVDSGTVPFILVGNKYDLLDGDGGSDDEEDLQEDDNEKDMQQVKKNLAAIVKAAMKRNYGPKHFLKKDKELIATRDPLKSKKAAARVKLLNKVEKEFGFAHSVVVSAKDQHGKADGVLNALLRYLLKEHFTVYMEEQGLVLQEVKDEEERAADLLEMCSEDKLNELFQRCTVPLKHGRQYLNLAEEIRAKFKKTCGEWDLLASNNASVEDCIVALRKELAAYGPMMLVAKDEENFVKLDVTNQVCDLPDSVIAILALFNFEVWLVYNSILRDCPLIISSLQKLDTKIATKSNFVSASDAPDSQHDVFTADKNRAEITVTVDQLSDTVSQVRTLKKKVQAAILW